MNPFRYPPRQQAKALVAALTTVATSLTAGADNWPVALVGAAVSFYAVFAVPNSQ